MGVLYAKVGGEWVAIESGPVDIAALTEKNPGSVAKSALSTSTAPANTVTTLLDSTIALQPNEAGLVVAARVSMVIVGVCDVRIIDFNGTMKDAAQVNGSASMMENPTLLGFCGKDAATGLCRVRIDVNTWGGVTAAINAKSSIMMWPVGQTFATSGGSTPAWPTRAPGGSNPAAVTPVWTPLALPSPLAALAGSWALPSYAVIDKMLHMRGSFSSPSATAANFVVWDVPPHLHPVGGADIFACEGLTNLAPAATPVVRMDVRTGGATGYTVVINAANSSINHISLANIRWPVA